MKKLSIIRRVDALGRIVIPANLRRMMQLEGGQDVELIVRNGELVLRRFEPGCIFCGGFEQLSCLDGKVICGDCRRKLLKHI